LGLRDEEGMPPTIPEPAIWPGGQGR
jgi:hypothetical protein